MSKVKKYKKYLDDLILESMKDGELPFILSDRLINLLKSSKHNISKDLLDNHTDGKSSKFTLIDYHDKENDMFTYSTSNKLLDYVNLTTTSNDYKTNLIIFNDLKYYKQIWGVHRANIKIGRLINKIFPDKYKAGGDPGNDISSFVDEIKSKREVDLGDFIIVEGEDIVKYYHESMYEKGGGGSTLYGSCMKYDNCSPYIGFYPHNNIKLVVLLSENKLVKGRALLWDVGEIDGSETDRKFLDRIYVIQNHDVNKFKDLATRNEWLYKVTQDRWANTPIYDTKYEENIKHIKVFNIKEYKAYPYMDTLKYFDTHNGYLTNDDSNEDEEDFITLESPDGGYTSNDGTNYIYNKYTDELISEEDMIWSEVEERFIPDDYSVYSEYSDSYISRDYADNNFVYSDEMNDWIPKDEAIYIESTEGYVSRDYALENYVICEYDDKWYSMDESLPSERWGAVPSDKAVLVIVDDDIELDDYLNMELYESDGSYTDIRYINDNTYFTIEHKDKPIHIDNDMEDSDFVKKLKKGL